MTAAVHTPGPWGRVDRANYAEIVPADGSSAPVIAMVGRADDANLIAAAPELLEACIALQREARTRNCGLRIADEAIAKARGAA